MNNINIDARNTGTKKGNNEISVVPAHNNPMVKQESPVILHETPGTKGIRRAMWFIFLLGIGEYAVEKGNEIYLDWKSGKMLLKK